MIVFFQQQKKDQINGSNILKRICYIINKITNIFSSLITKTIEMNARKFGSILFLLNCFMTLSIISYCKL